MEQALRFINEKIIWALPLVVLCLAGSIYFTIRTRFAQVRLIKETMRLLGTCTSKAGERKISGFAAFAISTAGKLGVGNIVGVGIALNMGGAGAVFWMWCFGLFGAALSFAECTLAQIFRVPAKGGGFTGGTGETLRQGLGQKRLGMIFSVLMVLTVGLLMPAVQANSMMEAIVACAPANPSAQPVIGAVTAALFLIVAAGGKLGVARFAEKIMPIFAIGYMAITLLVSALFIKNIPSVFARIISEAFGISALGGGALGAAISVGIKRGMFSSEAGYGIAPYAAASAESGHPAVQGLIQSFSIFVDTLFMCTATAFMILASGAYKITSSPVGMAVNAVNSAISGLGMPVIVIAVAVFAFTTIVSCGFIATTELKGGMRIAFYLLMAVVVFISTLAAPKAVWDFCDIGTGIMAWINIPVLFLLSKPVIKTLIEYENEIKKRKKDKSKL